MKAQAIKISLFLFFQIIGIHFLAAQPAFQQTDAVHLHTGQIYQGIIIEQKPGESIRLLRNVEGDTLTLDMESIERIVKVVAAPQPVTPASPATPPMQPSRTNTGLWATAVQVTTGGGDHSVVGLGMAVQRRLNNRRSWVGLGLSYFGDQNNYGPNSIALALHSSHELSSGWKDRLGALVFADLGYSMFPSGNTMYDEASQASVNPGGGLHLQTGLRFRVNVLRNAGLWFDLSYLRHSSTLRKVENDEKVGNRAWNMVALRGSVFF